MSDGTDGSRSSRRLHAAALAAAGVAFGLYVVVAQARREQLLLALVACLALLAAARLLGRRTEVSQRTGWWEWVGATTSFALLVGGWALLDETDPSGPSGAPWSLRVVVLVVVALPLAVAGWLALRDRPRSPAAPTH